VSEHRLRRYRPLLAGLAAAVLTAGLVAGCEVTLTLNESALEENIHDELQRQTQLSISTVECPGDRPLRQGDRFTCTAVTDDGMELEISVVQDDDQGNVSWEVTGGDAP
jgi:hypothetical protein